MQPTTEASKENVKRASHQALVWQSLEAQNSPELDSMEYGWVKDDQNKSLQPVTLPGEIEQIRKPVGAKVNIYFSDHHYLNIWRRNLIIWRPPLN